MKLAIFGNNRSGTTMLTLTLMSHLKATGENESWSHVSEIFSTSEIRPNLVVERDGHLQMYRIDQMMSNYKVLPKDPTERFMKFIKYSHQDYIVKLMTSDTNISGIIPWMRDNYRVIAIERRNPLAAFISDLIATKHQVWNVHLLSKKRPTYVPFVVDEYVLKHLANRFVQYYKFRDELNPTHIIYYEDIANGSPEDILRMVDMKPIPGAMCYPHDTIKLHSFREKMDLILNFDEVSQFFETIMKPYGVTMEHNNL